MQGVLIHDHVNQLDTQHCSNDQSGERNDDGIVDPFDERKHVTIPAHGRLAHIRCDRTDFVIDVQKHRFKVCPDTSDQQFAEKILDGIENTKHGHSPLTAGRLPEAGSA